MRYHILESMPLSKLFALFKVARHRQEYSARESSAIMFMTNVPREIRQWYHRKANRADHTRHMIDQTLARRLEQEER